MKRKRCLALVKELKDRMARCGITSLTFAPCANMSKEERKKLETHLSERFSLWASTWILPALDEIAAHLVAGKN